MLTAPRVMSFRVADLEAARRWYGAVLDQQPILEAPFAVAFSLGDCTLLLLPREPSGQMERPVPFFGVDDIEGAFSRLVGAGAVARSEITFTMLRSRMAKVEDPFGNVFGITSAAEKTKPVESRPSESAMTVAFSRALAAHDDREGLHGPDHLAEVFLNEEGKKALGDRAAREWILGKMAGSHQYFLARTLYLDETVRRALCDGVPQLVFLGAGYDSRPYRLAEAATRTRIFEVDVPATQQRKRALLARFGVTVPGQLVYVEINFEKQAVGDALVEAGFDPRLKTLFVWEGVTYYLTGQSVDDTLESVRRHAGPGSALCFDYMIQAPDMATRYGVKDVLAAWRSAYSAEPVRFGIDEGTLATFLSERGYRLLDHLDAADLERRFLTKADGSLAGRVVALFGLVRAEVVAA